MFRLFFISAMLICGRFFAQVENYGSIYGNISDKANGDSIPFVTVALYSDSISSYGIKACSTDLDGNFIMKDVLPGKYILKTHYVGYKPNIIKGVVVKAGQKTHVKFQVDQEGVTLDEVEIVVRHRTFAEKCISMCKISQIPACYGDISSSGKKGKKAKTEKVSNAEDYSRIVENDFRSVMREPLSTMSIDVDRASYSNIRRFINQGSLPPKDAVRVEEMINYFNYHYAQPQDEMPFSITTEYTECAWNKNHNIVHIGIQGRDMSKEKAPASNLVFLIDVSGSMSTDDRLPLVKSGLRLLVGELRAQDKVSIVVYAGAAGMVLPPTSGSDKQTIMNAIDKLGAGGSTAGGAGIELAYKTAKDNFLKEGNNRVILATDGDFNVGVNSDDALVQLIEKKRTDGIYLTVLGFGTGNYKDSKMEKLADKGNGNYAYVDNLSEAKKVFVQEMSGTLHAIAKDVKVQVQFNPAKVKAYRLVGYENRVLRNEDFNDDTKDAGELGAGHTVTAIYEIVPASCTERISAVNERKYKKVVRSADAKNNELMTLKLRYKQPKSDKKSILIEESVTDEKKPIDQASENTRFSSAVAQFGMILRDSKFKGQADYKSVITMANLSKGKDEEGYRSEFIRLVEKAASLKSTATVME
ncbi:MAG: hypothetical protein K0S32_2426 [Bacteroidetes bacterium]|jgi:Ca-activated chloride channel family protein|nr:hypothetical protein [Bacteroidota bacterium]